MTSVARGAALRAILLWGFIVLSQHMGPDGLWWRVERGPVTKDECRTMLKAVTGRPKVKFTAWYDVTPAVLAKHFGTPDIAERGTWLACWPEGTDLSEPES